MTNIEHINRRKYDRFAFENVFVLETENFSGISNTSSINLSQKGAHLVSKTPLTKGSIVSIEMPSERIQLMGEVCWVGEKGDQHYNVGVAFHEFIPVTKTKIANLIQRIQTEPETAEGQTFSFELENKVSNFLDKYVEEVRPDPIVHAPVSYRRLGTPTEKTLSFYTPSKPQTLRKEQPHLSALTKKKHRLRFHCAQ
ncbi:MAG: PilZ domain-containing protein [Bdellovibrionota bacterium]